LIRKAEKELQEKPHFPSPASSTVVAGRLGTTVAMKRHERERW